MRFRLGVVGVLLVSSLSGCGVVAGTVIDGAIDAVHYPIREYVFWGAFKHDNDWDETWAPLPVREDPGEAIVGITFSGGGSRSAYFATCVLEELGEHHLPDSIRTYLDELDVIGGVSGGGMAAAYYCANRGDPNYPADPGGFFNTMRKELGRDFETRFFARLAWMWPILQFTYYDGGDLMADVWDANLYHGKTFADLDPDGPTLLLNATCYNTGEKFVFTRQRLAPGRPQPLEEEVPDLQLTRGYAAGYVQGGALTMESIDSSIAECPLVLGVTASAAVPAVLGPVTLEDRIEDRTLYLGDGGIYDNHGVEALFQVLRPMIEAHPGLPVYVLVIDAAGYFDDDPENGGLDSVVDFGTRSAAISSLRATTYAESTFRVLRRHAVPPDSPLGRINLEVISLYDDTLSFWDLSGSWSGELLQSLKRIATGFSIDSDSAEAIETATPQVVFAGLQRLEAQLEARRIADDTAASR